LPPAPGLRLYSFSADRQLTPTCEAAEAAVVQELISQKQKAPQYTTRGASIHDELRAGS